jgi:hypothetical protein
MLTKEDFIELASIVRSKIDAAHLVLCNTQPRTQSWNVANERHAELLALLSRLLAEKIGRF